MAERAEILRKVRLFATELEQPEPDVIELMNQHSVNVYALRHVFLGGHFEAEERSDGSLADAVHSWDQQGKAVLQACVRQGRSPTSEEKQQILEPLDKILKACDALHELMTFIARTQLNQ